MFVSVSVSICCCAPIEYNNFNKIHAKCVLDGERERDRERGRECLGMDNAVSGSLLTSTGYGSGSFPVALSSGLGLSDWRRVNDNQVISIMPENLPALAQALAPRGYKSGAKLRLSRL